MIGVGKISDIFAGQGITQSFPTHSNSEGMEQTLELSRRGFSGLCFVNLVDFDSLYGHRRDPFGYAKALEAFDAFLPSLLSSLRDDDLLLITGDHGCDPCHTGTDHTREWVPLLLYGKTLRPYPLGDLRGLSNAASIVERWLKPDRNERFEQQ